MIHLWRKFIRINKPRISHHRAREKNRQCHSYDQDLLPTRFSMWFHRFFHLLFSCSSLPPCWFQRCRLALVIVPKSAGLCGRTRAAAAASEAPAILTREGGLDEQYSIM